jgi:hypothetical protein
MRVAIAAVIALLILSLVDEQFNSGRLTEAATVVLSQIAKSFG